MTKPLLLLLTDCQHGGYGYSLPNRGISHHDFSLSNEK
jgi:hypothetical protein